MVLFEIFWYHAKETLANIKFEILFFIYIIFVSLLSGSLQHFTRNSMTLISVFCCFSEFMFFFLPSVKKGYHKVSLKVHPDRVSANDKEEATKKFQILVECIGARFPDCDLKNKSEKYMSVIVTCHNLHVCVLYY